MDAVKPGLKGVAELTVGEEHTAPSVGSGAIHVLGTPVMINLMEAAALAAAEHLLPEGHQSLGIHLDVSHVAATPVGMKVWATAKVTAVEGNRILTRRWVRRSTRPFARGGSRGAIEALGYGYLWWTGNGSRIHKMYYAAGYAGQYIMIIPRLSVTIVATADANCGWEEASQQGAEIRQLIADHLLVPLWEQGQEEAVE